MEQEFFIFKENKDKKVIYKKDLKPFVQRGYVLTPAENRVLNLRLLKESEIKSHKDLYSKILKHLDWKEANNPIVRVVGKKEKNGVEYLLILVVISEGAKNCLAVLSSRYFV